MQPLTLFLQKKGFDGLIPHKPLANQNRWGTILFPKVFDLKNGSLLEKEIEIEE